MGDWSGRTRKSGFPSKHPGPKRPRLLGKDLMRLHRRRGRRGHRWRNGRRVLLADRCRRFLLRTATNQQCNAGNEGEKGQRQWGSIVGMHMSRGPIPMLAVLWERSYEAGVRKRPP